MNRRRKVECETKATVFERSEHRVVIVTVDPQGSLVGFRLKGTRQTYELDADALFCLALKADMNARTKGKR